jgi:hypothetical protein
MTEANDQNTEAPQEDPLLLGQLTPDEFAQIAQLNHQKVTAERQIAQLEIQKYKIMANFSGVDRALQQSMEQIGTRLNIPREIPWTVVADGRGNGLARAVEHPE